MQELGTDYRYMEKGGCILMHIPLELYEEVCRVARGQLHSNARSLFGHKLQGRLHKAAAHLVHIPGCTFPTFAIIFALRFRPYHYVWHWCLRCQRCVSYFV